MQTIRSILEKNHFDFKKGFISCHEDTGKTFSDKEIKRVRIMISKGELEINDPILNGQLPLKLKNELFICADDGKLVGHFNRSGKSYAIVPY